MNAETADPAAIFAITVSLRAACEAREKLDESLNLGAAYAGVDGFWRELVRVASLFEDWACKHLAFEHLEENWPYFLEDHFGRAFLGVMDAASLATFQGDDCLRVAMRLSLPISP